MFWIKEVKFEQYGIQNGALNAKVLLLNQSYEPLSICNVRKALILIVLGKADCVIEKENKYVHSVSQKFPWPSIIRLNSFIRVPYKKIILTRKNILRRDNHKCGYCGRSDITLTLDHIVPKCKGGPDTWENLVAACIKCNNRKGNQSIEQAGMKLSIKPYTPNHIMFMKNSIGRIDEKWKSYLFQS